jgi:hypothetical protein
MNPKLTACVLGHVSFRWGSAQPGIPKALTSLDGFPLRSGLRMIHNSTACELTCILSSLGGVVSPKERAGAVKRSDVDSLVSTFDLAVLGGGQPVGSIRVTV